MSTKELAMETIKGLPEAATWREIEDRIHLLAAVNTGCEELQRGEGIAVTRASDFLDLARGCRSARHHKHVIFSPCKGRRY